jgi:hypothetical protein
MYSQVSDLISYQAIVRSADSELLINKTVGMKISILKDSATGSPVYVETQTSTTNSNGLLSFKIGTGIVISGDIKTIDWSNYNYFIKTESDPKAGQTYTITEYLEETIH